MKIDWFITRACDQAQHCSFCYAPWNFFPLDVDTGRALEICDRLKQLGVDTVTLCVGEPLLFPGLESVVQRLNKLAIRVVLYTNGTTNTHKLGSLLPSAGFLSLPVDAVSKSAVDQMRGPFQFECVSAILSMLALSSQIPKIKIGTVVTRQNIDDLCAIGDFLYSFGIVDVWRLYEFSPYGIGKLHQERFLLSPGEFERAISRVKDRNNAKSGRRILISERSRQENEGYCMIIDSVGSFYRYAEKYIPLGVTIDNLPDEIVTKYDQERHARQKAWL